MKYVLAFAALLVCGIAAPAMADNGHVPSSTLNRLGLKGLQTMSETDGLQVRGMGGNISAMGLSVVSGVIIHPSTKDFVSGTSANSAMANAEHAGPGGGHDNHHWKGHGSGSGSGNPAAQIATIQSSFVGLNLTVVNNNDIFAGVLLGGAGGAAAASIR